MLTNELLYSLSFISYLVNVSEAIEDFKRISRASLKLLFCHIPEYLEDYAQGVENNTTESF